MNTKHTPTPWTAHDDDGTGTLPCVLSDKVNKGGNFYVAQCNNYDDAAFIVTACNAYDELLAALKPFVDIVSPQMEADKVGHPVLLQIQITRAELAAARAAIAKAENWTAEDILRREG